MKNAILCLCLAAGLLLGRAAAAQNLLPLTDVVVGHVHFTTSHSSPEMDTGYIKVGTTGDTTNREYLRGMFEFVFPTTGVFPPASMTANNFRAKLNLLIDWEHMTDYATTGSMTIELHDMPDSHEDGDMLVDDYGIDGGLIATRQHVFFSIPDGGIVDGAIPDGAVLAEFINVNVTAALRRDLFGAGMGQPSTGFVLKSIDPTPLPDERVRYLNPTLTLYIYPDGGLDAGADAAPDAAQDAAADAEVDGGDGDADGDTDTDADTDTDTDVDTDTDADTDTDTDVDTDTDADTDTDTDGDGDSDGAALSDAGDAGADAGTGKDNGSNCGCATVGSGGHADFLLSLLLSLR